MCCLNEQDYGLINWQTISKAFFQLESYGYISALV